jgi:uncharacterized membrane protein
MRLRFIIVVCVMLLFFIPLNIARCENYIQYNIQIKGDSSALWTVTQVSDPNSFVDTLAGFQQKVVTMIDTVTNQTGRNMSVDPNSLQIQTTTENQSKTTVYTFVWLNFSQVQDGTMVFGDVFQQTNVFDELYGEGYNLQIAYPVYYSVKSVNPLPNVQNPNSQTLEWYRTQDFINGKPSITLTSASAANSVGWQQTLLIGLAVAIVATVSIVGLFAIVRHRQKQTRGSGTIGAIPINQEMETEEDKILKVIRSSGGSLNQATIAEQCKFSKAKTSQLLTALEQKGVVRRYKKGRDKIVTLAERDSN